MASPQHGRALHGSDEVDIEIDDTHHPERMSPEARQAPVLVLSRDANLVETVKKAAPRGSPVAHAPDLDHVAEQLAGLQPGVLVIDTASTADVASMVAQLTQHFPDLVVVVAGKREDSSSLMQLTAAGRIFRFLLSPLSHGQTRLALEAAVTQHLDLIAAGERLSSGSAAAAGGGQKYLVTYGALGAGLLLIVGAIWLGVSQITSDPQPQTITQPALSDPDGALPEKPDPVQAELALAQEAFDQGKFLEPAGESALDLYRSALALDPNSAAARQGVRAVVDKVLERAESALLEERLEEAIQSIEIARDIDAAHPRLAFMDTQIARERERLKLSQAQEVGQRVRSLLALARDRMASNRLTAPTGGSARDALLEARRLDPTDPNVAQGIRDLAAMVTEEARKAVAAKNYDDARNYIATARALGFAGAALAAVERSLADATRGSAPAPSPAAPAAASSVNVQSLANDVRQRITQGKLIDPAGDSARDVLNRLSAAGPNAPEVEELSRALTTRLLEVSKQASAAKAFERASQLIAAAREVGGRFDGARITQAERELVAARDESAIISAANLKRTRTVNPEYPETARRRGIEGWVEIAFTVTTNGTVEDVEVRNASPANVFDDAAVRAVRQWRFEPVVRNGEKVSQRAMLRLRFAQGQ